MSRLFEEFPPISTEMWEEAIRKDLKGSDYTKKLVRQSEEGLKVKPYYRSEDLSGLEFLDAAPGEFPYVRGVGSSGDWRIREEIDEDEPKRANQAAMAATSGGAEEIEFRRVQPRNISELETLLRGLDQIPIHFRNASPDLVHLLLELRTPVRWSTGLDPLRHIQLATEIAALEPTGAPFTVDAGRFEEAGATTVQEVGFALAAGIDFLAAAQMGGTEPNRSAGLIGFSFAIGSNYFFQIAKLRAFRMLWGRAIESFGGDRENAKAKISARSSRWNKTIYDPIVNILRGTTEAMSAVLGGADSLSVASFDSCYKAPDEASRRLARNTQIILKREAQLARVADPGGGSYYLEAITDSIAREAWKVMQEIEAAGGFRKASDGIGRQLQQSLTAREKAVSSHRVFVGTNRYPNPEERALDRLSSTPGNDVHRGAEVFEQIRLRTERHALRTGKRPGILLAEVGDMKMRRARSNFAYNLFGCAGFDIIQRRFDDVETIARSDADLIVLCSSDAEYPSLAASLIGCLKQANREIPIIIAGNPESAELLKSLGVADFVHLRSNPIEILERWQARLGVKG